MTDARLSHKEEPLMQSSPEVEFKVGDKAVYPAQGVAEVISIDEKDIAGSRQRFWGLEGDRGRCRQ